MCITTSIKWKWIVIIITIKRNEYWSISAEPEIGAGGPKNVFSFSEKKYLNFIFCCLNFIITEAGLLAGLKAS